MVMQTITAEARDWTIETDFGAKPRIETKYAAPEDLEFPEEEWSIDDSFFKKMYFWDEAYNESFTKDWRNTNLRHFIREHDTLMLIKDELKAIYPQLIQVFKKYSARSVKPDNVYISYTELYDLLHDFDVIDDKSFKKCDYDVIFNVVRENEEGSEIKPEAEFVRHEFIEALVRIGIEKYKVRGDAPNEHQGFAILRESIEDEIDMIAKGWKEKRFFTQEMDVVFTSYLKLLLQLFEGYAKVGLDKIPKMPLKQFEEVCVDLGLINPEECSTLPYATYHQTMLPLEDEMTYIRNMQMSFMEFLEGFSRMVDACPLPIDEEIYRRWYNTDLESSKWPLDWKLESIIPNVLIHLSVIKHNIELRKNDEKLKSVTTKRK